MRSRRLRLPSAQDFPVRVYTYHDSCYLERWNGIFEAPRNILRLIGGTVAEMEASHAKNLCCGGGGGGCSWKRTRVSASTSCVIAVACPYCLTMFADGLGELGGKVQVMDIAEILEERISA